MAATTSSGVPTSAVSSSISCSSVQSLLQAGDPPEVVGPLPLATLPDLGDRLLGGLGEVGPDDQAPLLAPEHRAVVGGSLLAHRPLRSRSFWPPMRPAPSDRTPTPWVPAHTVPAGDVVDATAIGMVPLTGSSCSCASWSVNQSAWWVTTSPASSRTITPSASSIFDRLRTGSRPSINESETNAPGPTPSIARPLVR